MRILLALLLMVVSLVIFPEGAIAETEPNNTMETADYLDVNITGQLMSSSDQDWYYFDVTQPGSFLFQFNRSSSSGTVGVLIPNNRYAFTLYNSEGTILQNYTASLGDFHLDVNTTGRYYIRIVEGGSYTSEQYTIATFFTPAHIPSSLVGVYTIYRHTQVYDSGEIKFDSENVTDFVGNAVFLNNECHRAIAFSGDQRYYMADYFSYSVTSEDSTMVVTSYLRDATRTESYLWDGLYLTISGRTSSEDGEYTETFFMRKVNNLEVMGPSSSPLQWDINQSGNIDLPDVINGLQVLTTQ